LQLSRQFWGFDAPYTAILYRLDGIRTQVDDVYGETLSEEKIFFPPVEVTVVPNISEVVTTYQVPGGLKKRAYNLTVGFYLAELLEKQCRPHDGDFMLYNAGQGLEFYELGNVDELLGTNTLAGVPFYVGATAALVPGNAVPTGLAAARHG
jgi:hypothetical protein